MTKLDLRVERTYTLLTNALLELMKVKTFDQITVGELCHLAMIRRSTFYKHFGDKYDLYSYVIRTLQEEFKNSNQSQIENKDTKTFFLSMFDLCIQFVEQHPYIIKSLTDSKNSQILFDILTDEIENDILYYINLNQNKISKNTSSDYPELVAAMISGAMVNMIKWWVGNTNHLNREDMLELCSQVAFNYLDTNDNP